MKNILIIDVETNGLDSLSDSIVEIGAVLYSIEHHTTLTQFSMLTPCDSNACERINRIPESALRKLSKSVQKCGDSLLECLRSESDFYIAHNAEFDKEFLGWDDKPWLCTCFDFAWPQATKDGQSLISLALDHGIGVSSAHRALTDCQLIAALFDRMDDPQSMIQHANRPKAIIQAIVSYDDKDLAKESGFKWDAQSKTWTRRMAIADANKLPFRTSVIRKL